MPMQTYIVAIIVALCAVLAFTLYYVFCIDKRLTGLGRPAAPPEKAYEYQSSESGRSSQYSEDSFLSEPPVDKEEHLQIVYEEEETASPAETAAAAAVAALSPEEEEFPPNVCRVAIRSGKRKGQPCGVKTRGLPYCKAHGYKSAGN